jgi:hypothetical protein
MRWWLRTALPELRFPGPAPDHSDDSHTGTIAVTSLAAIESISGDWPVPNQPSAPSVMIPTPCESWSEQR